MLTTRNLRCAVAAGALGLAALAGCGSQPSQPPLSTSHAPAPSVPDLTDPVARARFADAFAEGYFTNPTPDSRPTG